MHWRLILALSQIYILVGVLLMALEIVVPGFVLAPLGLACLFTAGVAFFSGSIFVQLTSFCFFAMAIFISLSFWKRASGESAAAVPQFGLVGKVGTLVELCMSALQPGKVSVFGVEWEILWDDLNPELSQLQGLPLGARLRVKSIVGNKVIVEKLEQET